MTAEQTALCDYAFDNLSGDMHGVLHVAGYPHSICPTLTLMNNFIYWSLIGAYVQAMEDEYGEAPYYWMSCLPDWI